MASDTTSVRGRSAPDQPRDGQQLTNHSGQPLGLLADDPEASIRPIQLQLLGIGPDAGQRRLEVVADPAQEVVLGRVQLQELLVLGLHLREQLRIPDRRRHLACEQLEQVLVGPLPAPRRRQSTDKDAEILAAGSKHRPKRTRDPGHDLLGLEVGGLAHDDDGVDQGEGGRRVGGRSIDQGRDAVPWRDLVDRREDPAALPIPAFEVRRESIVAVGQARQLVLASDLDRVTRPTVGRRDLAVS